MSKRNYKNMHTYKKAKVAEYLRYYKSTQLYEPHRWDEDEEEALILLTRSGYSAFELSGILGRSTKAIEHRRHRLRELGKL